MQGWAVVEVLQGSGFVFNVKLNARRQVIKSLASGLFE